MIASLLLVGTVLVVLAGTALAVVCVARRDWRRAAGCGIGVLALGVVYAATLVTVAITSRATTLAYGQVKCFDDWCVTVRSVTTPAGDGDRRQVTLVVTSRARGIDQRPDSPAVHLVTGAGSTPLRVPGLDQRLAPGQAVTLVVLVTVGPAARRPRLLVTEGGAPSRLVIGDENSPFHATSTWPL